MATGHLDLSEFTLRPLEKVKMGQGVSRVCECGSTGTNKATKLIHKVVDICASYKAVQDKPDKKVNLHSLS